MYIVYNNLGELEDTENEDDADEDEDEEGNHDEEEEEEEEQEEEEDDVMNAHMQPTKSVKQTKKVSRKAKSNEPKKQRAARGSIPKGKR